MADEIGSFAQVLLCTELMLSYPLGTALYADQSEIGKVKVCCSVRVERPALLQQTWLSFLTTACSAACGWSSAHVLYFRIDRGGDAHAH